MSPTLDARDTIWVMARIDQRKFAREGRKTPSAETCAVLAMIRLSGLPEPVLEHHFHDKRKWRLDLAWPDHRIAIEIDGGTYSGGRHTRGKGFEKDHEKFNAAAILCWRVFRFTTNHVRDTHYPLATLKEAAHLWHENEE